MNFSVRGLLERLSDRQLALFLFATGLVVRLAIIFIKRDYHFNFGTEMINVANHLAAKGAYAHPFVEETGATAIVPPGYPLLLTLIAAIWGDTWMASLARMIFTSVVSSLQYALFVPLSKTLDLPRRAGFAAGLLGALVPFQLETETRGYFENTISACLMIALLIYTVRWFRTSKSPWRSSAVFGLAWGLTFQIAPSLLPVLIGWLLVGLCWYAGGAVSAYAKRVAVVAGMIVLVSLPWTVRNYLVFGHPVWVRDNLGLEWWLSNMDCSQARMNHNFESGCFWDHHPGSNPVERQRLNELNEVRYCQEKMEQFKAWVAANPGRFVELTATRAVTFWFQDFDASVFPRLAAVFTGYYWLLTALGFVGFALLARDSRWLAFRMLLAPCVLYPLVYYVNYTHIRFRYPIFWITLLLAVYAVLYLRQNRRLGLTSPTES
jgi:hypothetical protein